MSNNIKQNIPCSIVILGKSHYLLYTLVVAMYPRWLVTLDEDLEPLPVSVRVGQVSFFLMVLTLSSRILSPTHALQSEMYLSESCKAIILDMQS